MVAASLAMMVLRVMYQRENARRGPVPDQAVGGGEIGERREVGEDKVVMELEEYADLTDKQIPEFRYTL